MNYECHITVDTPEDQDRFDRLVQFADEWGWKSSWIERDPLLGDKQFFYFTRHSNNFKEIEREMDLTANVLDRVGYPVLRKKIEMIVFDTKKDLLS